MVKTSGMVPGPNYLLSNVNSVLMCWGVSLMVAFSRQTGGATAEAPLDSISLNFSKIEMTYREQTAKGTLGPPIRVGWDRKTNKAF